MIVCGGVVVTTDGVVVVGVVLATAVARIVERGLVDATVEHLSCPSHWTMDFAACTAPPITLPAACSRPLPASATTSPMAFPKPRASTILMSGCGMVWVLP